MQTIAQVTMAQARVGGEPAKRVYVCGKVTGLEPLFVNEKFMRASKAVWMMGFEPVNPVELVGDPAADWGQAMAILLPELLRCDGIYVQSDWRDSKGSYIEIMTAHAKDHFFLFQDAADVHAVGQLRPGWW